MANIKKALSLCLIVLLLSTVALVLFSLQPFELPYDSLQMIGHRGYSAIAPENTLPAFKLAGEHGFWGVECDITPTADGVWVLMHDNDVDRMTDGTGIVTDLTYDEIRALRVDSGNGIEQYPDLRVPTLVEYLDVCKEYALHPVIEIKSNAKVTDMDDLAAVLSARPEKDLFTVITFERTLAARMKELMPETPVFLLVDRKMEEECIDFCLEHHLDGIDFAFQVESALVRKIQEAGLATIVWTVDSPAQAKRHYDLGVRAFTTNKLAPR